MIKIVYMYDVVPGKALEAKEWARKKWIPFWIKQPCVKNYEVFTSFFSPIGGIPVVSPQRMVSFEIDTLNSLEDITSSKEFFKLTQRLQSLVKNFNLFVYHRSYPIKK